jgi:hypothetical protein
MMKEELHRYLEKYVEHWKNERDSLPMVPFDEDCETKMYVGEIDKDEYIQWNYRKKDNINETTVSAPRGLHKLRLSKLKKEFQIGLKKDLTKEINLIKITDLDMSIMK